MLDGLGRQHYPALDGLRGVAVSLVVVSHLWPRLVPGGAFGVTLFFVLSGFLITRLVTQELDDTGEVDLWLFYRRRAARLAPALLAVAAAFLAFGGSWSDAWPALAYVSNWMTIEGSQLGAMQHTWSLSVEEHFYLVWPILVAVIPRRSRVVATVSLLAGAVGWRMWMMDGSSLLRVTVGTDTVAFAILAGCLHAVLPKRSGRYPAAVLGIIGLAILVDRQTWAWAWTEMAVVALSMIAIDSATGPVRLLEMRWLAWLGRISYGLYLWHHLLIRVGMPTWAELGLSLVVAWLSWRAIEQPALRFESLTRSNRRLRLGLRSAGDPSGSVADGVDQGRIRRRIARVDAGRLLRTRPAG